MPTVELLWTKVDRPYTPHVSLTSRVALIHGGAKSYCYRGQTRIASPGSLILAQAGEAHSGGPVRKSYELFMLSFEDQSLLADVSFETIVLRNPMLARRFRSVCAVILDEGASPLQVDEQLQALIDGLERRSGGGERDRRSREPAAIARAREMLHDSFAARLSLDELVENSRLPKARFLRTFRDAVGLPPHEYQLQLRVEHAKRMIAAGSPLVEASAATGFFDQSHFHRHFTRIVGVRPGIYRAGCWRRRSVPQKS